jgi:hypothetical protein
MMKLNTPYNIDNGLNSIVFSEGKKGSITGAHNEGTLTGFLNGNILSGTFHNTKVNATGLIEITFHENGFDAKWKQGMEPGPMRGKWEGTLNSNSNQNHNDGNNSNEKVLLEIYLRYDYPQEEINSFEIELLDFSEPIQNIDKINFDYLEDYIGKLHSNSEFTTKLQNQLTEYEFYWDQYPQIWITKVNDVNLKPLYDYHFNNITDDDSIISILKVNDDIEDWVSDYHSQTVFSIERLN